VPGKKKRDQATCGRKATPGSIGNGRQTTPKKEIPNNPHTKESQPKKKTPQTKATKDKKKRGHLQHPPLSSCYPFRKSILHELGKIRGTYFAAKRERISVRGQGPNGPSSRPSMKGGRQTIGGKEGGEGSKGGRDLDLWILGGFSFFRKNLNHRPEEKVLTTGSGCTWYKSGIKNCG